MENKIYFATILAIDDNTINLRLITEILSANNYKVLTAINPEKAYEIYISEKIDLVLLDLKIISNDNDLSKNEYLKGYEVIKKLKELNQINNAPIIFLTSISDINSKVLAFKYGAVDFITKPFNTNELLARIELQIKLKREMESLSNYNTNLEKELKEKNIELEKYTKNLEQLVEEKVGLIKITNEILKKDLESARRMQKSILPKKIPFSKTVQIDTHYFSCDKVGGDFYDVFNLDENHIGFYVADVSGHGVSASMITFFVKEIIDNFKKTIYPDGSYTFTSPGLLLEKINLKMLEEDFEGLYLTIFYGILNIFTGELIYSNGGHIAYPIIFKNKEEKCEILKTKSMALGWFDYAKYKDEKIILYPQDKLIIYTDGIIESRNEARELYSINNLTNIILQNGKKSISTLAFKILKDLRKFQNKGELEDDITLILINFIP